MAVKTSFSAQAVFVPAVLALAMSGCGESGGTEDAPADSDSDADSDSGSGSNSDSGSDSGSGSNSNSNSDSGSGSGLDSSSGAGSDSSSGAGSDSDSNPEPDPDPDPELDPEASEWLSGHNSRRETYHAQYGGSYVPMKWSASLAASAKSYAEEMAITGVWAHSDSEYGENLAWNGGEQHLDIENVMTRWVEDEEASWGGHFTQVLWRATKYVGCGRASSSEYGSFQVCQYVTPGNCGSTSLEDMMADTTGCLPECPLEGCF